MVPQNSLVTNFLQNKEIHTGLELLEDLVNDDRIFILGELSL